MHCVLKRKIKLNFHCLCGSWSYRKWRSTSHFCDKKQTKTDSYCLCLTSLPLTLRSKKTMKWHFSLRKYLHHYIQYVTNTLCNMYNCQSLYGTLTEQHAGRRNTKGNRKSLWSNPLWSPLFAELGWESESRTE
jgi:hypothetical protein